MLGARFRAALGRVSDSCLDARGYVMMGKSLACSGPSSALLQEEQHIDSPGEKKGPKGCCE